MASPSPRRADLAAGACYAIQAAGEFYFGQIADHATVGFFRFRGQSPSDAELAFAAPLMCRISVPGSSINRAVRNGTWIPLGRREIVAELRQPHKYVIWPIGGASVEIISVEPDGSSTTTPAEIEQPDIQTLEIAAVWDAEDHAPGRLRADFEPETAEWHVGGPVRRERQVATEFARRFPDSGFHLRRAADARLPPTPTPSTSAP